MDHGKRCVGADSRYVNGKGYASKALPGMIFQKDPDLDYISKIRLTAGFKGRLPDGTPVNMDNLLLKDVIKRYPALDSTWSSRDCSDYWTFSNDTIAFYVKIDPTKKPQYPVDKAFYLNKPVAGIDILVSCYSVYHRDESGPPLFGQDEPMFFLDSIRVNLGVLKLMDTSDLAALSVYKGQDAVNMRGNDAKNGLVYVFTKRFAREKYWKYFQSKSDVYRLKVPDRATESGVVYIVNGEILTKGQEGTLFWIDDNNFIDLTLIDRDALEKKYQVTGHAIGVVIRKRSREEK
jgi:hypothetical protein